MSQDPVVIVSVTRTPMGALQGVFSGLSAAQLGAVAIKAAVERAGIAPGDVQEVIFGNVLGAGQGQAPARQAMRGAGLPDSTHATTINKMCGSGLKAVMLAHDLLKAGTNTVMVAGGMESMTNAPHLLMKQRSGIKYGHGEILDHMAVDGLEDAYQKRTPMGAFAEQTVEKYGFTREQQDAFALESLKRAKLANEDGSFEFEIATVEVSGRKGPEQISKDEGPYKAMPEKIPSLKPAFKKDGTVTAANASSINDGAAAVVLTTASEAAKRGLKNLRTTPDALPEIVAKSSIEVFERQGVLSKAELESREEIYTHSYVLAVNTESKLVSEIAKTLLLPAALKYAADLTPVEKTKSGGKVRKQVVALADELAAAIDALDAARDVTKSDTHAQAKHSCDKVLPAMLKVRAAADALEEIVADEYWPLPSYQELLFLR